MHGTIDKDGGRLSAWLAAAQGRTALWLLWAVFVAPRAALIALQVTPTSDADWYYYRAADLAAGIGYVDKAGIATAYWPPGWPMALSVMFRALGTSVTAVGLANFAFAVLAGWLLLDIARRIAGSELAARAAFLLFAVYPNAIGYVPLALTEVFYTTLLLAICWLLVVRPSSLRLAIAGLVLGLATQVKAQSVVIVPLILGIELLRAPGLWRRIPATIVRGLVLATFAALVVAPWTLRNYREMQAFIPVSTNGGITLLTGNNDSASGAFTPDDPVVHALDARTDLDEMARDAEAKRLGMEWIMANPGRFVALMPMKLVRLWGPDGEAQWAYETGYANYADHAALFRFARIANQAFYWSLLGLFAAAAVLTVMRRRGAGDRLVDWWLLPYGIALYPSLIAMVFSGQSRFHYPAMPFICLTVGWLLADWLARRAARTTPAA